MLETGSGLSLFFRNYLSKIVAVFEASRRCFEVIGTGVTTAAAHICAEMRVKGSAMSLAPCIHDVNARKHTELSSMFEHGDSRSASDDLCANGSASAVLPPGRPARRRDGGTREQECDARGQHGRRAATDSNSGKRPSTLKTLEPLEPLEPLKTSPHFTGRAELKTADRAKPEIRISRILAHVHFQDFEPIRTIALHLRMNGFNCCLYISGFETGQSPYIMYVHIGGYFHKYNRSLPIYEY